MYVDAEKPCMFVDMEREKNIYVDVEKPPDHNDSGASVFKFTTYINVCWYGKTTKPPPILERVSYNSL